MDGPPVRRNGHTDVDDDKHVRVPALRTTTSGTRPAGRPTMGCTTPSSGSTSVVRALARGLHSSTFQLNLCDLYGIGGARWGCEARVMGVLGDVEGL
jgi:hypothetical protein